MKIPGQLKQLNLIALALVLNIKVFAQTTSFIPDAKKDSIWIQQSLITANKLHPIKKDINRVGEGKWISEKVIYSPDRSLRATQLIADYYYFTTAIEYIYHHKIYKQDLDYKSDFSSYALTGIYKLPDENPAYLFLFAGTEHLYGYEHERLNDFLKISRSSSDSDFQHIRTITYVASVLRLDKDSLIEKTFPPAIGNPDDDQSENQADTAKTDSSKSFGFISDIKHVGKFLKPFLRYDSLAHTLSFLDIYSKDDAESADFLSVHTGSYMYKDSSFLLMTDTSYYYPSLKSLKRIVFRKNYRAGKYIIKGVAITSYEDFGNGNIWEVMTKKYKIGSKTLTCTNSDPSDDDNEKEKNLKPDYRLQNNSSLILLLTGETNEHRSGMCGSATYFDSDFYLINGNNKRSKQLFSFSYGSCSSDVKYTFTKNRQEVKGTFYVTIQSDEHNAYFQESFWKNNSTYVFVFGNEGNLSRNFYLHFNVRNKKSPVTLTAGKLYKVKNNLP